MIILNSGGTFNKRYNPLSGQLEVPYDNEAVETILSYFSTKIELAGVIYKDSLEMTLEDRKMLTNIIYESKERVFIVVHGTDTMDQTAEFFANIFEDRIIVLTGAMIPFEIDPIEASANLALAIGYAKACDKNGIYIAMQGEVASWDKIVKNRAEGRFEIVED